MLRIPNFLEGSLLLSIKRPNGVLYFIVYILLFPLLKLLFKLEVDRKDYNPPDGPFLVVSNHVSFMDFLLVMLTFYPRRLNAVAAQKFYYYRPLNKLLPMMGCIPKNLFDPDVRSIIGIKAVLKRGGRILLFPEGRCTAGGAYMGVHKSTGKLVKKLGVPVISCHIEGAYTCMPFWRKGIRLGRERITLAGLFSAEDTKALSIDDLNAIIDSRLGGFETPAPVKPFRTFKHRRLAEGLHNLLYWCPGCGRELTLVTENCNIRCTACGNAATMDRSAKLIPEAGSVAPETVQLWYKEQSRYEASLLSTDMEPVRIQVTVRMPKQVSGRAELKSGGSIPPLGLEPCGAGTLSLDPDGWHYIGDLHSGSVNLFFPIDTVPALPFDPGDNFQIYAYGKFYAFTPEDKRLCSKFATIGECAYWRFASRVLMTPGRDGGFSINEK